MPTDNFFDTNILIYLTSNDLKRIATTERLVRAGGVVSVQVLNEIARVLWGKMNFSWVEVGEFLTSIKAACRTVPLTIETHERGLAYAERYRLGVYDAMIVAAAALAGCTTLYSEDMHHGLVIDGVTIRNPFR
jgi:predicted nucleic acid-binding protein